MKSKSQLNNFMLQKTECFSFPISLYLEYSTKYKPSTYSFCTLGKRSRAKEGRREPKWEAKPATPQKCILVLRCCQLAATATLIRIYAATLMSWHVWRILETLLVSYDKRKSVILITLLTQCSFILVLIHLTSNCVCHLQTGKSSMIKFIEI